MVNQYGRGKPNLMTLEKVSKVSTSYKYILQEAEAPARPGRRCKCGTVLSIYNTGRLCNVCKRKRLGIKEGDFA